MSPRRRLTPDVVTRARQDAAALVFLLKTAERGFREDNPEGVRLCLRKARLLVYEIQHALTAGIP